MPDIPTLYTSPDATVSINATYDRIWLREVVISAPQIGGEAEARVMLARYRLTETGVEEAPAEPLRLHLRDLLAGADSDPDLAAVVTSLMAYVAKAGIEQGLVAAPE
jgi:hypothetical protein